MIYSAAAGGFAINAIIGAVCLYVVVGRSGRPWLAYIAAVHMASATSYAFMLPNPTGTAVSSYVHSLIALLPIAIQSMGAVALASGGLLLYSYNVKARTAVVAAAVAAGLAIAVGLLIGRYEGFVFSLALSAGCMGVLGIRMILGPTGFYRLVGVSLLCRGSFTLTAAILTAMPEYFELLSVLIILNLAFIAMTGFGTLLIELDDARHRIIEADQAKTAFIANMSHELRTPLNAIIGFSEIVTSKSMPLTVDKCETYSQHVLDAGRHLLGIINQLLDMASIEARREKLNYEPVAMDELVKQCIAMLHSDAERYAVALELSDCQTHQAVATDARAVRQIVVNLISNALKFSHPNSRVKVAVNQQKGSGDCTVTVADQGIGMNARQIGRIFDAFWQGESTYVRSRSGIGLGLAIAKRLADALDASLSVESEPAKGTSFALVLPGNRSRHS